MPIWTHDQTRLHGRLDSATPQDAPPPAAASTRAMATASDIFSAAPDVHALPRLAASALADQPGQMCLVSLTNQDGEDVRPAALAHAHPETQRSLRTVMARSRATTSDAFSRQVLHSGKDLRMPIGSPLVLRLWLPRVYWPYAERVGVSAVLAAPFRHGDRVLGTLLLCREGNQPAFDESDQAYVVSLAARLAFGLAASAAA